MLAKSHSDRNHPAYYFIRANGDTAHADPGKPRCFVPGEPVHRGRSYFNLVPYCLSEGIARIGWPDTGDLTQPHGTGALGTCYSLASLEPHQRHYLEQFRDVPVGSVVLLPDKDLPGTLYVGDVTRG